MRIRPGVDTEADVNTEELGGRTKPQLGLPPTQDTHHNFCSLVVRGAEHKYRQHTNIKTLPTTGQQSTQYYTTKSTSCDHICGVGYAIFSEQHLLFYGSVARHAS